jgi:hypothetical protein
MSPIRPSIDGVVLCAAGAASDRCTYGRNGRVFIA